MAVGGDHQAYILQRIAGVSKPGRYQPVAARAAGVDEHQPVFVFQQGDAGADRPELEDPGDDVERSQDAVAPPAQARAFSTAASGDLAA